jgi:hypothetical protein
MKPHPLYEIWRPDEVAECMEGVTDELYRKLWDFVPLYKPHSEDREEPTPGIDCLADFWDRLTIPEQQHLNTLAQKQEEQYK